MGKIAMDIPVAILFFLAGVFLILSGLYRILSMNDEMARLLAIIRRLKSAGGKLENDIIPSTKYKKRILKEWRDAVANEDPVLYPED
jgi:cytoplasmic iron level regulating protein YaaA (DUF328/UPF0246 family)